MKGFILGVLLTLIVGGFAYHMQAQYRTFDTCAAYRQAVTRGVLESFKHDIESRTGSSVAGDLAASLVNPVSEPLVRKEVESRMAGQGWFDCAWQLIRFDFMGEKETVVADVRDSLFGTRE